MLRHSNESFNMKLLLKKYIIISLLRCSYFKPMLTKSNKNGESRKSTRNQ